MRTGTFVTVLIAALAGLLSSAANADNLRCGSKLVSPGDSRALVRSKCGDPTDVTHKTLFRRPSYFLRGHVYYGEEEAVEVEEWLYNFGPSKFMRRVRFVDGVVDRVDALDYGFHE